MKQKTNDDQDQVKLKPFMGIRPGVYLTVIYSIILLTVIFFLFVFPGIRTANAALVVKTQPSGAAIRINDVYMGLSGTRIIIPRGTYTITAVMPGFESQSSVQEVSGRVFGSRFFPRLHTIEKTLTTADPSAAFALYAHDFASWTFGGEATEIWQIPMSLSEGAYRTGRKQTTENRQAFQDKLLAASRFSVTRAGTRDLIRAKALIDGGGNTPSPLTLLGSISETLVFLSENPGSAAWLSRLFPGVHEIRTSQWANDERDIETSFVPDNTAPLLAGGNQFNLAGMAFRNMGAGTLFSGNANALKPYGNGVYINSFLISETPVPRPLFETFLNENPEWREHQRDYFPNDISTLPLETHNRYIYGITWQVAEAFCRWLTGLLPPGMADMEVRLPTEHEWEYAAISIGSMLNAGWEWCADPFAQQHFISAPWQAVEAVGSPDRSLRGRQTTAAAITRASLPLEFSSPFVTFRPVIAPRR
ncbi:MAG: SUMF1/EgtB/PvdO family nonheme iron enzyme [Treponema sp.]|nr:SUMF1/EgtB/PvdO family nonheme iron enzyme [Treponema sp.]